MNEIRNQLLLILQAEKEAEKNNPIDTFIDGTNTEKTSNINIYKNNKKLLEEVL